MTERILLGDPFDEATTMGPLNNEPVAKKMDELVPFFFGADYGGAVVVTRILLSGAFFFAIRRVFADGAKGIGLPGLGSIAELGSWISLVSLLAVLMPLFGLEGVATAIAISSALSLAILVVALLRKSDPRTSATTRGREPVLLSVRRARDHKLLSALDDRLSRGDSQRSRRALVLLTRSASSAAS